eukprot:2207903-Prymnesium_polylepis.1
MSVGARNQRRAKSETPHAWRRTLPQHTPQRHGDARCHDRCGPPRHRAVYPARGDSGWGEAQGGGPAERRAGAPARRSGAELQAQAQGRGAA